MSAKNILSISNHPSSWIALALAIPSYIVIFIDTASHL